MGAVWTSEPGGKMTFEPLQHPSEGANYNVKTIPDGRRKP